MRWGTVVIGMLSATAALHAGGVAAQGTSAPQQAGLILVGRPTITVDSLCNPLASSTGVVKIRNQGRATVPLSLTATDLSSKAPVRRLVAKIELVPTTTAEGDKKSDKKELAANEEVWIKLNISGVYEEGEWETTLQNENVDVGTVRILKADPPFHVSLDVPNADTPELTFVEGKPAHFGLKNEDSQDHTIGWEYAVNGVPASSGDPLQPGYGCRPAPEKKQGASTVTEPGRVLVPAKGFKEVRFSPPCEWFGSCFTGLFKDQTADGRLVVSAAGCPAMTKVFKVKTHLATSIGNVRELWSDVVIFLVLLAGGVCSLALNFALPNLMRRLKLRERLDGLETRISDLSTRLASRLRVLVGLEQSLLKSRLKKLSWIKTDFAAEAQSIEQALTRLDTRVRLLDQLGATREDFERLRSHALPPSRILAMEDTFEKVVEIGKKSDPTDSDIQSAQALIGDLQKRLAAVGQPDETLVAEFGRQVEKLRQDLVQNTSIRGTQTCKEISEQLKQQFSALATCDPKTIQPRDYADIDTMLCKLRLVENYVSLVEGMPPGDAMRTKVVKQQQRLLDLLKIDSWEAMSAAQSLASQIREGRFKDDIQNGVARKQVRIRTDEVIIRVFQPCEFRLEFLDPLLDKATARDEWICRWTFKHPDEPDLTEEGWEVSHYFQKEDQYTLQVTLIPRPTGQEQVQPAPLAVEDPAMAVIKVRPSLSKGRHTTFVLELLRFALTLVIVLLGMIAGAKDQILKLDLIPALIAIFLTGFGADQIKKLLTERQP